MPFICHSDEDLIDLIKRFGKSFIEEMCLRRNIKYEIDLSEKYLLKYGFNKKILNVVRGHIKHGKMLMHINKINGKIKKTFRGYSLYDTVRNMKFDELPQIKDILMRLYDRVSFNIIEKYKKQFEGIDLETDPITFEPIVEPVYIKKDWDNNCKMVYSSKTVDKLYISHWGYYISPYTRDIFQWYDIEYVIMDRFKN